MKLRVAAVALSLLLYGIALISSVFILESGPSSFVLGFVCLLFGFLHLAWYANPLLLAASICLLIKRDVVAAALSTAAILVALTTLGITEAPRNEAGHMEPIVGYQMGFYFWLTSMVVILACALYARFKRGVQAL